MTAKKQAKKQATKSTAKTSTAASGRRKAAKSTGSGFTAEERAAMRDRVKEMKSGGGDEASVLARIAAMAPDDRALAERIHAIVRESAPSLTCRLWYGMPAYARDGQVLCFFQDAKKFKSRYATFGFSDKAKLDDGAMWATGFAVTELTPAVEKRIAALVKQAAG